MSTAALSSQVVPVANPIVESNMDEEAIRSIALGLSNPSPFLPKTFDFDSPRTGFTGPGLLTSMASGSSFNIFATSFTSPNPGLFLQSPFPFANSSTPQATLLQMSQAQPTTTQLSQAQEAPEKVVPVTPQQKTQPDSGTQSSVQSSVHSSSGSDHGENTNDCDSEPDAEDMEQDEYHETVVPSADESEASFSGKKASKRRKRKAAQPIGSHVRCFADLTDDEVAFMDFKELTRLMNAAGLSRQDVADTKARRRRLKNRQSARLCSNKKRELCNELSVDKDRLEDQLRALQTAHAKLQRDYEGLRQQYAAVASSKRVRGGE